MAVTPPNNLATNDIIDETWVDATRAAIVELQARGYVGSAQAAANQSLGASAIADVTGLSVTFTAVAGHRYKVSVHIPDIFMGTSGNQIFVLTDAANVVVSQQFWAGLAANSNHPADFFALVTPAAGAATYKARVTPQFAASLTMTPNSPGIILVEDIG